MDERVHQFREGRRSGRWSEERKALAVAYTRDTVAAGGTITRAGRDLGVRKAVLSRWMDAAPGSFRVVDLEAATGVAGPGARGDCGIVLLTGRGHRVFGLSVADLCAVLREIG